MLFFVYWQHHKSYNQPYLKVAQESSEAARKHYGSAMPKLVEIDDGVVGYSLDTPAMSFLLALDPEGFRAFKQGHLLDLAMARGFDRVASAMYRPNGTQPAELASWIGASLHQDVSMYDFEREFASPDGHLLIVRVRKR